MDLSQDCPKNGLTESVSGMEDLHRPQRCGGIFATYVFVLILDVRDNLRDDTVFACGY
jgi:hypothetical protein